MKKFLSLLTITTMLSSASSSINLSITSNNHNFNNKKITKLQHDNIIKNIYDGNKLTYQQNSLVKKFINSQFPSKGQAFAMNVTPEGTIYVAITISYIENMLYKSTDKGITFTQITDIPNDVIVNSILVAKNGAVYVGSEQTGLYKSFDETNFIKVNEIANNEWITSLTTDSNGIIYVGTEQGLYKSTDNGNTFTKNKDLNNHMIDTIVVAPNGRIYIITYEDPSYSYLWKSVDKENFEKIKINYNEDHGIGVFIKITPEGIIYAGVNNQIYKSTDNGNTFTKTEINFDFNWDSLYIDADGILWVAGVGVDGLYKSTDGIDFIKIFDANKMINAIIKSANGIIYVGTWSGLYKSTDNGSTFTQITDIPNTLDINIIMTDSDGTVYLATQKNGLYIYKGTGQ